MTNIEILNADCRDAMALCVADHSVQCCVTSPPYFGLRDYGHPDQLGLEATPEQYIANLVEVFSMVRRVLRDDGVLWLNIGDGYQSKELIGIPWRLAFALRAAGWYLRQDLIWHKPNPMPESVRDRCTKAHEYLFLLSKSEKYYFNHAAIQEPSVTRDQSIRNRNSTRLNNTPGRTKMGGLIHNNYATRNRRSVWTVATVPYKGAHFATFPPALIEPCILAGSRPGDTVLDPFGGSGTTAQVALQHGRRAVLCELNPDYIALIHERITNLNEKE